MAAIPHPGVAEMNGDFMASMGRSMLARGRALIPGLTPGRGSAPAHPAFDPPVQTDWPHQPYDPHGLDYPRDTSIETGIRERGIDLFKGGVQTTDILARGLAQMERDIAKARGRDTTNTPIHGFGLAPGSPMGAFIKPPTTPLPSTDPNYFLTELESAKKELGYKPKVTWQEVKQSTDPLKWGRFILQEGLVSTPDMAAVLISTPAYIYAHAGQLAEDRAKNQGRNVPNGDDLMWAIPTAAASAGLERVGARGILFGKGATPGTRIAKAGAKEAGTEAAQESIEYTGTKRFAQRGRYPASTSSACCGANFSPRRETGGFRCRCVPCMCRTRDRCRLKADK